MKFKDDVEVSINDRYSGLFSGEFDVGIGYTTDPEANDKRIDFIFEKKDDTFPCIPQYAMPLCREEIADIGKEVVIIGGNATGCETAHFISAMGIPDADTFTFLMYHSAEEENFAKRLLHGTNRNITVIEMAGRMAENVGRTGRWSLMKSLRLMGVNLRTKTRLIEIKKDLVIIEDENGTSSIPADTVIMAVGAVSDDVLAQHFKDTNMTTITIGDAKAPRKIPDAVLEGFEAALSI